MVMELLPEVLQHYLEQHKALPRDRFQIAVGVARGMRALSEAGKLASSLDGDVTGQGIGRVRHEKWWMAMPFFWQ